ncbi:hypothetical protein AX15_004802 [Amanita polypyramis BW_CC]|nr:hypothetical protein AX15_004802 [Amanita polypyramis BW_CC]
MIRFDTLPPEVMQAMCTPMHLILEPSPLPGSNSRAMSGALYLGSLTAVNDQDLLRQHCISHLVQVIDIPWLPQSEKYGFNCYRIDIVDHSAADLKPHLEAVCSHIDEVLRGGKSVLVHCQQGISRSAAVVIAYLIRSRGMSYHNAYEFIKRKRACIKPNPGFVRALQDWEASSHRPTIARRFTS